MKAPPPELVPIIGESAAFLDVMDAVSHVAPMDRPILVVGERGTGKELIAARLHFLSNRWNRPFIKLNCAALPETLLDSELFGHEAGAFTGASRRRAGRFETADGGSLFLDEIATMSMAAQEKLLRVIEYGEFERVGGSETQSVDVRVIGATNMDLPALAAAGLFRPDLLDRLAFDVITVPPLRARRDDILVLVNTFGQAMAQTLGWPVFPGFTREAEAALIDFDWPGNVRELKNVVERAVYRAWDGEAPIGDITFDPFASPWRPATALPQGARQRTGGAGLAGSGSGETRGEGSGEGPGVAPGEAASEAPGAAPGSGSATETPQSDDFLLPDQTRPFDYRAATLRVEEQLLREAYTRNRFHQKETAVYLGLSYDQLRHALKKHDLL